MRRLPIFFLVDCSESMAGDSLKKMEDGIGMIVRSLRTDPHALESVYLSVIAFAGVARTVAPLVEVVSFYPPKLPIGSGTSLGAALQELMKQIDTSVVKTTNERKGDWRPIVYLFTDGKPTDDVEPLIAVWRKNYAAKIVLVAIALGKYADLTVLRRLTDTVVVFEGSQEGDFKKFIQWVTDSLATQSRSVREGKQDGINLAKLDEKVLTLVRNGDGPPMFRVDLDCIVFVGRCQKTHNPYLMKYDRVKLGSPLETENKASLFELTGCYTATEEYFAWSTPAANSLKVNTNELVGCPSCPYCGNPSAFAMCGCGKLMCVSGPGVGTCPWCETKVEFGGSDGGARAFDVQRGRG